MPRRRRAASCRRGPSSRSAAPACGRASIRSSARWPGARPRRTPSSRRPATAPDAAPPRSPPSACRSRCRSRVPAARGRSARFARERQVPYFGICFGMQRAVIEAARHLARLPGAGSTAFGEGEHPAIGLMTEWMRGRTLEQRTETMDLGGTMRLGAYEALLDPESRVAQIYGATQISERHRHRYEVNIAYRDTLEAAGLRFSGMSPDGLLPEIVELPEQVHPWFIGVQFHPELKSRPFEPHPLFSSFIRGAVEQSRLV